VGLFPLKIEFAPTDDLVSKENMRISIPTGNNPIPEDKKRGKYKKRIATPTDLINELSLTQLLMIRDAIYKEYEANQSDSYYDLFVLINKHLDKLELAE